MYESDWEEQLEELSAAEEFLEFFDIEFEPSVVFVNRLHILQRFHDYLNRDEATLPTEGEARYDAFRERLGAAYEDFVTSDALTEKVFKVFRMHEPQSTFVSVDDVFQTS